MTGDVEEECSLLQISQQLDGAISSATSVSTVQVDDASYINANMTIGDTCMFTTVPTAVQGHFPEGTVLQVLPDATVVTLAMKNLPTSNANAVMFKDPVYISENATQNAFNSLLTSSSENNATQAVTTSLCTESVSDIDLSFLNEAEVVASISDSKYLNESAVKELQGMISDVSSQSLNLLQNSLNITESNDKPIEEIEQTNSEISKDVDSHSDNVVMIDVSKPIQLSQNSLITVDGQKCILQQDPQTGQVVAFPVKEPEKPRRRRGRPRKASVEQVPRIPRETRSNENIIEQEAESMSENEKEKGLLEIMNDDGALVRRSTRKRKKKVLRDYETGNLQQELGSDVDDNEIVDNDTENYIHKRKAKGPGRPRKYTRPLEVTPHLTASSNNGIKRQRGRPRKYPVENEPTQAFLVQTADGQTLMMQVPLSSIPPGITLQQMAEQIALKLNEGLNQPSNALSDNTKNCMNKETDSASIVGAITSTSDSSLSEPALQDHAIGSTTSSSGIHPQFNLTDENSEGVSSCQDMINHIENVIVDSVGEVEEITLESENVKSVAPILQDMISENILNNQNNLTTLDVPHCSDENFCINISSTTSSSIDTTPILCNIEEKLSDKFCMTKADVEETLAENFEQVQTSEVSKHPDIFNKNGNLKDKVNFQFLLQNSDDINANPQNVQFDQLLKSVNSPDISESIVLNVNDLKVDITYPPDLIEESKNDTDTVKEMPNAECSDETVRNSMSSQTFNTVVISNIDHNYLPSKSVGDNCEVVPNDFLETTELNSSDDKPVIEFAKQSICPDSQPLDALIPLEDVPYSINNSIPKVNLDAVAAANIIPNEEKPFPMILAAPPATGPKNCKICKTPYSTDEEIIQHFRTRHPKCICSECDYMAERPYVIKRHFYRHTNQLCICKICNKKYKDLYILKMHIRMVHLPPDVLYTCDICEKQFTRKAHLKRHLRIHAPVKQFQCPHCDYKGCEKSDITKHILIHEAPKFQCEICGKAFRHLKNKELHMKRHSGKKDYKCGMCEFYGYTFTDIRKHIERRHSNAACPDCGTVFKDANMLKDHKKMGVCQPVQPESISVEDIVKLETPDPADGNKDAVLLDEVPVDFLDGDQQHITIRDCSEETLYALQNGQLIMTSAEGILNNQNTQLVMEGLDDNIIVPDNLSVVSVEKDSNLITLVTTDGRNLTIKNCSASMENGTSDHTVSHKVVISTNAEGES